MIKALLWKEYREQRWKLAFGTVMLLFVTGSLLAARLASGREIVMVVWVLGGLVLALYSAMGVLAPERTNGTTLFLAARPVRAWESFAAKWLMGWLNVAGPMVACSVVLLVWPMARAYVAGEGSVGVIVRRTIGGLGVATMFYTLTVCVAPRRVGEAGVGLTGLGVFLFLLGHVMVLQEFMPNPWVGQLTLVQQGVLYMNPLLWIEFVEPRFQGSVPFMLGEQAVVFAVVLWWGWRGWRRSLR